ncbi:hypothetical protein D7W82_39810, partial [Corallococcus sp. CA049B]|uniref:hypothetical protein n=1 Tax=Corallococcus sp. CA049B TaxID=2316730 RepID=UPI000EE6E346
MAQGFQQAGDTPREPHPGQRLGNRYELRQRVKVGRGISTWQGLDLLTHERVLVKVTALSAFVPTSRHRLEHEAEVLSRLHNPALV